MSLPSNDRKINYIEFPSTDIAKSKDFYGSAFGWKFQDWGPDYCSFSEAGIDGGFRKVDSTQTGGAMVILYGAKLEEVLASVKKAGGRITKDIYGFPGGRRFEFLDPSGNELAVWSDVDQKGQKIS